jgi:uncharacterized membrane protein YcaP (DUF421 family)
MPPQPEPAAWHADCSGAFVFPSKIAMSASELRDLFSFSLPWVEIIVRGSLVYWFLWAIFRFIIRRDTGAIGIADTLVIVLVADASQNAMAGEYKTVADGYVLIGTIIFWNYLMDFLSYRFPSFQKLIQPATLTLVREGRLIRRNMAQELLREEDLMAKLREHGVEKLSQVRRAYMESDGAITVIRSNKPA